MRTENGIFKWFNVIFNRISEFYSREKKDKRYWIRYSWNITRLEKFHYMKMKYSWIFLGIQTYSAFKGSLDRILLYSVKIKTSVGGLPFHQLHWSMWGYCERLFVDENLSEYRVVHSFLFCLELDVKILEQNEFAFKGDQFHTNLSNYFFNPLNKRVLQIMRKSSFLKFTSTGYEKTILLTLTVTSIKQWKISPFEIVLIVETKT